MKQSLPIDSLTISPLLSMLNSCAAGITVVNIDNGYGAAMAALRMSQSIASKFVVFKFQQF